MNNPATSSPLWPPVHSSNSRAARVLSPVRSFGEIIFFARRAGVTNGLVVERDVGCSLYANFDQRLLLSTDFTQLPPELIMSTVALSMTETLFNDLG